MRRNKKIDYNVEIDDTILTASRRDVAHMEFGLSKRWLSIAFSIIVFGVAVLMMRVVYLSVVKGNKYQQIAQSNSMRSAVIPAPRGQIFDVNGQELVINVPQVDLVLITDLVPRNEIEYEEFAQKLALATDLTIDNVKEQISQARRLQGVAYILREELSPDEIFEIVQILDNVPGVQLVTTARRQYLDSNIFAHILGYTGKINQEQLDNDDTYYITDYTGSTGIEKQYETVMRGIHGYKTRSVDALGRAQKVVNIRLPEPGNDLYLNIDAELQKKLSDLLVQYAQKADSKKGAVVAIDPRDGSVRALVSIPSYDNNLFTGGVSKQNYERLISDENKPLFNRAVNGAYAPGSTVKPWIAGAALTEGVVNADTTVLSTGAINVGRWKFRDWRVNGLADARRAIAVSHDIYFYAVGGGYGDIRGMGIDTMKKYYELFGMGAKTGIDMPSEARGFIPSKQWKQDKFGERWSIGNDYHASIGQGYITATPLQIAVATAAVANGGTLWRPRVAAYQRDKLGNIKSFPSEKIQDNLFSPEIAQIIREGTRMTVTEGTAQMLKNLPIEVAGKTGTAQFGGSERTHSWFASYAPYDNPELVIVILVEGQSKKTSSATVPVAYDVWKWYAENRVSSIYKNDSKNND